MQGTVNALFNNEIVPNAVPKHDDDEASNALSFLTAFNWAYAYVN